MLNIDTLSKEIGAIEQWENVNIGLQNVLTHRRGGKDWTGGDITVGQGHGSSVVVECRNLVHQYDKL